MTVRFTESFLSTSQPFLSSTSLHRAFRMRASQVTPYNRCITLLLTRALSKVVHFVGNRVSYLFLLLPFALSLFIQYSLFLDPFSVSLRCLLRTVVLVSQGSACMCDCRCLHQLTQLSTLDDILQGTYSQYIQEVGSRQIVHSCILVATTKYRRPLIYHYSHQTKTLC